MDLPGVNAQEKTKEELMEALRIGGQEMLVTELSFEPNSFMATISIQNRIGLLCKEFLWI